MESTAERYSAEDPGLKERLLPDEVNGDIVGSVNPDPPQVKVYKRRWYILLIYSLFAMVQAATWNTWSPIAHPAEVAFDWTDGDIALFNNYGCIVMVLCMMFFSWLIVKRGFRIAIVSNAFLCALGAVVRCFPMNNCWFTVSCHVSALLNGLAVLGQGAPAMVSSIWFPANERATATAIGSTSNLFGIAVSFVVGPQMVHDIHPVNSTNQSSWTTPLTPIYDAEDVKRVRQEIMLLMYLYGAVSTAIFLAILTYFPSTPGLPPSASAAAQRIDYVSGLKRLLRNLSFWSVVMPYSLVLGVYGDWSALIDVILKSLDVSQGNAGWIGFGCILAAVVGGFLIARLNDIFQRRMKQFLLVLQFISAVMILWFALMAQEIIPPDIVQFYISAITASLTIGGSIPLYYEKCCETAYPVPEAVTSGLQMILVNSVGASFYFICLIPNIGTNWMNWVQLAVIAPSFILICSHKETYGRLDIDDSKIDDEKNYHDNNDNSFLLVLQFISAVMILWFALMAQEIIPPDIVQFYISAITASLTIGGSIPLYYEKCCETAYPVPEAVTSGLQMILVNSVGASFYFICLIPNIGTNWMNWVQLAVIAPSFILICSHKETYGRLDIDDSKIDDEKNYHDNNDNSVVSSTPASIVPRDC